MICNTQEISTGIGSRATLGWIGKRYLRVYIHKGSDTPAMRPETDTAGQSPRGRKGGGGGGGEVKCY